MKILHISSAKTWRGGENQILLLLQGLEDQSVENVLMCPKDSPLETRAEGKAHSLILFKKRSGVSPTTSWKIKSVVNDHGIDIIHVHDSHALNYALMAKALGARKPIVVTRRVDFRIKASSVLKYNHRYIEKIICVSKVVRKVMQDAGVSTSKLEVINSGIDLSRNNLNKSFLRESLSIKNKKVIVGFVGALVDHKDPITFVAMANHLINVLNQKQFYFVMAGLYKQLGDKVGEVVRGFELESSFSILGFVEDVDRIWSGIDLLVVTSKKEGLGTGILEAFSRGVPVVCTNAGGISELVEDNKTGIMTTVGNYIGLADGVLEISQNEEFSKSLVKTAFEISLRFDYRKMSRKYFELYKEILR